MCPEGAWTPPAQKDLQLTGNASRLVSSGCRGARLPGSRSQRGPTPVSEPHKTAKGPRRRRAESCRLAFPGAGAGFGDTATVNRRAKTSSSLSCGGGGTGKPSPATLPARGAQLRRRCSGLRPRLPEPEPCGAAEGLAPRTLASSAALPGSP